MYISSADWMSRNLDRRIEVACPIEQEEHKKQLLEIFDQQWNDQVKGGPHFEVFDTKRFIKGKSAQEIIYEALNTSTNKKRLLQE